MVILNNHNKPTIIYNMLQLQYYVHGFIDLPLGLFTSVVVFLPTINQLSFTWWLIPVSKWIIAPAISELTLLRPVITRGIIYLDLLSGGEPPSTTLLLFFPWPWSRQKGS